MIINLILSLDFDYSQAQVSWFSAKKYASPEFRGLSLICWGSISHGTVELVACRIAPISARFRECFVV